MGNHHRRRFPLLHRIKSVAFGADRDDALALATGEASMPILNCKVTFKGELKLTDFQDVVHATQIKCSISLAAKTCSRAGD